MKRLVILAVCLFMTGAAYAYDSAKLQIEVSGSQKNQYYICVSGVGCVRMDANQKALPINTMDVRYIFLANTATYQMYPQSLPSSCNVSVNSNQKLVVKGTLATSGNKQVHIANLHCAVV